MLPQQQQDLRFPLPSRTQLLLVNRPANLPVNSVITAALALVQQCSSPKPFSEHVVDALDDALAACFASVEILKQNWV